jgi:hypothetical protein
VVSRAGARLSAPVTPDALLTVAATFAGAALALLALELAGEDYVNFRRDRVLLVLGGLAVTVLALPLRRAPWGAAALGATWVAGWIAFTTVPEDVFIGTPVNEAAGGAAYYGTPYIPQQLAGGLLQAVVLGAALAGVLVASRRNGWPPPGPEPEARTAPRGRVLLTAAAAAVLMLAIVPDLSYLALGDPLEPYKANQSLATWDISNLITWLWLIDDGAVPMKDFFWPYGQTWVFNTFPLGPLWAWLANCATLALASWALWRMSPPEGRATRVVVCALALVLLGQWQAGIWRYGVGFVLALVYAALGPASHQRLTWGHLVLALAALNAALWGIDMLLYGIGGMIFVLLGELLAGRISLRPARRLLRGLLVDAVAMLSILILPLLWLIQGSFDANARFAFGLRGVSAGSAAAQNQLGALRQFIGFKPTFEMLSNVAPALLAAAGLVQALLGGRRAATLSRLLLAAAGTWFAVLLKHLVRPQGEIMFVVPALVVLWCAAMAWELRRWLLAAAIGALAATFVWTIQRQDVVDGYLDSVTDTPSRVVDDIELAGKTDRIEAVDRRQFTQANLPRWPLERSLARQLGAQMRVEADDSFAVFGDAPFLYIFYKQRPPFHIELYDGSRRVEQDVIVERLEEIDPNLILWRRDYAQDSVPQAVRNPIVLRWIVERYVPVRRGPVADVLRRRRPGERLASGYWRARLGDPLSLGYVPGASSGDEDARCELGDDGCEAYAVLEGEPAARDQPLGLTITGGGRTFGVIVLGRPGESEYAIRLDRLWFAPLVGAKPRVETGMPGFEARLAGHRAGDDLW